VNSHENKLARLRAELAGGPGRVGLAKARSNLFRDRERQARPRVDLSGLQRSGGSRRRARARLGRRELTTYADLVEATLAHGVMLAWCRS